ncbi:MAG TPA: (Fe-S)-binding protein [Spirochaetia bacterium]|nr:(Fe-S)-binding protein [Spirochaetia bacterium]
MRHPSPGATTLAEIGRILDDRRDMIRLSLQACAHCALCAESCFKFTQSGGDPTFTPSYKAINSIGKIWRTRGRLSDSEYDTIRELVWDKCVLCMRCACPVGISIPSLIALARSACRQRGIWRWHTTRRNA